MYLTKKILFSRWSQVALLFCLLLMGRFEFFDIASLLSEKQLMEINSLALIDGLINNTCF